MGEWKLIPCIGCNTIAFDNGWTYEDLEETGLIKDEKMVRHFPDYPFGKDDYPRFTGRQAINACAQVGAMYTKIFQKSPPCSRK